MDRSSIDPGVELPVVAAGKSSQCFQTLGGTSMGCEGPARRRYRVAHGSLWEVVSVLRPQVGHKDSPSIEIAVWQNCCILVVSLDLRRVHEGHRGHEATRH